MIILCMHTVFLSYRVVPTLKHYAGILKCANKESITCYISIYMLSKRG